MNRFNLNNRILMFAICSSIEYDLRNFLSTNQEYVEIPEEVYKKAINRNTKLKNIKNVSNEVDILLELDMGDLVGLIISGIPKFELNINYKFEIDDIFKKIIPIRNKVMHTRPIEFSDRGTLEESLHTIDKRLDFIRWNELIKTRQKLKENPQKLIVETTFIPEIDNETNIYHNLPVPEFDDTGFIGRKKEIKELTKLIESDKDQIITVVGNGGIGKTAIIVKCLYELLDSPNIRGFEAIIWISLKTRTLSRGEFININSSINDLNKVYSELHKSMVKESDSPKDDILSFMNEFSTLLVIDNLETIPTQEIIGFLKEIPSKSKVLITSRSGLGELENRYMLKELNDNDARAYFVSLSKYYQLDLHKKDEKELDKFIKKHLYSSPLSIKWYITGIFFGADSIQILSNREKLVEFAMSNIIEKLSENEIELLWLLLIEGKNLSYGEIDYYLDPEDNQVLISSINRLLSTSMMRSFAGGSYEINTMAKDYLKSYRVPDMNFIQIISKKRNELNQMMQDIKTKNEADPFNPKSIFDNLRNENTKIASYYLMEALKFSSKRDWIQSNKMIKKAEDVAPDYFEVHKIKAFINAENNNLLDAIESYRTSLENANYGIEKASVHYLFSVFYTIKLNDFVSAKKEIEEAEKYAKNEPIINLEKGRILMYLGEFDEALRVIENIDMSKNPTDKFKNQYASKIGDVYLRKSKSLENRDIDLKYDYLRKGLEEINKVDIIDPTTTVILIKLLNDLSYIFSKEESIDMFVRNFRKHIYSIQNNTSKQLKRLGDSVERNSDNLPKDIIEKASKLGINLVELAKLEKEKEKGIIKKLTPKFGFIENYYGDYYFKCTSITYDAPMLGDKVSFKAVPGYKGQEALDIKKEND